MGEGPHGGEQARSRAAQLTRRDLLKAGAAVGVAGAVAGGLRSRHGRVIDAALAADTTGSLADVEHLVILMQENRSFDHYFGTMVGVRGFDDRRSYQSYPGGPTTDPATVFTQTMVGRSIDGKPASYRLADGATVLEPFELISHPPTVAGQTIDDITHDWGPQHGSWNDGAMDRFMVEHLANDPSAAWQMSSVDGLPVPSTSSVPTGITAMGFYRRRDCLAFYRALAEAFTICDAYHCSVLGPTDPNRLMWMSGSIGAHSKDVGGPVLTTYVQNREQMVGTLDWPTMPELLSQAGVSWKVYQDPTSNALFNVLDYFKHFAHPATPQQVADAANGLAPLYPPQFQADVAAGTLPSVSWIIPPVACCEHPATPPEYGEWLVSEILQTLVSNPAVWEKTVFLVVYDENGGFFDHVAPPTPGPLATAANGLARSGAFFDGEYVDPNHTANAAGPPPSDWAGVLGPVGLGFRTPALVVSPFSTGGRVSHETLDHVSTFKLIEKLFLGGSGVLGQLHVSPWRYSTVGDFTATFDAARADLAVPPLPATSLLYPQTATEAVLASVAGTADLGPAYPPPTANSDAYLTPDPS